MRGALSHIRFEGAARLAPLWLVLLAALAPAPAQNQPAQTSPTKRGAPRAATLAEYRGRVGAAVGPLEELASLYDRVRASEKPEVWQQEGFDSDFVLELPKREEATLLKVRALLPPRERVESGGGSFVEADNAWLHASLDEFRQAREKERSALLLRAAAGRLRALEALLAEAAGGPPALDKDAERGRLNAILRDPAYSRETRRKGGALQRLIEELIEWLRTLFGGRGPAVVPGASPGAARVTQMVVLALCLAVVAYVARRLWARRAGGPRGLKLRREARVVLGERLEPDATAADLLEDAERLARAGDLRGAIRRAYVALLVELGDRGLLRLARHKTNRDYLNAVRRAAAPGLYTEMLPLTYDFELHWYGLRDASDADWEGFKARCRKLLKQSGPGLKKG